MKNPLYATMSPWVLKEDIGLLQIAYIFDGATP